MHDFPYWMINDYPSSNEGLDAVMYTSKGWCLDMSRHPLCDLLFWWYMGQLMSAIVIHMVRWRHDPSEACIYRTWCHYDVTIFRSLCPGMSCVIYAKLCIFYFALIQSVYGFNQACLDFCMILWHDDVIVPIRSLHL